MKALTQLRAYKALFVAVWNAVQSDSIPERGPMADTTLALRDTLNPRWPNDPDWLPEPLASEREAGCPNV